jgi:putative Mn2+ efflux pump MntP
MIEVLLLAIALSMDAFAVSIGLGARHRLITLQLAVQAALYFGIFQAAMPLLGYLGGKSLLGWVAAYAPWAAFIMLAFVGGKMIYESFSDGIEADISQITHRVMLVLAVATSIDAMAAGFALNLLDFDALAACAIIGLTTAVFSAAGVYIGKSSGTWLESKAELFGGIVLVLIGLKILLG